MAKESALCVRGMNTALVCVCPPWNEIVSLWCKPTAWRRFVQRFVVTIEGRLERYHYLQCPDLSWRRLFRDQQKNSGVSQPPVQKVSA